MRKCFDTISGQRSSCSTEFVNLVVVAKRVVATISFNPNKYARVNAREEVSTSNDKESEADAKLDSIITKPRKLKFLEIPGRIKNCIETPDNSDAGFHIPKNRCMTIACLTGA